MKKLLKRMLLFVLAVGVICGTLIVPAGAASTKQAKLPSLSSSKYIQCYTLKSSGKVYGYTNSSLKTKMGYIDCATDECYILSVSGSAIQVSLPTSSGRVTRWFKRSDFTATDISKNLNMKNATAQITTYRRADGKKSYGYVGKGDDIYVLGTSGSYTQVIYELTSGKWKMGWIKTSDANKYLKNIVEPTSIKLSSGNFTLNGSGKTKTLSVTFTPSNTTAKNITWTSSNTKVATVNNSGKVTSVSNGTATITAKTSNGKTASVKVTVSGITNSAWQYPMKNSYHTWGNGNSWGKNCQDYGRTNSGGRNYHIGIDIKSTTDSNVYAAAAGTVQEVGENGANGKYVTIKHTINGKTVYSFYAHLKSTAVKAGATVKAGTKIGVVGNTGSGAGSSVHLHFAIIDSLSKGGGYYGYATKFSGNKTTYSGRTYYNPVYVIENGKLP